MHSTPSTLAPILETQIRTLALTLRPSTVDGYRSAARNFLAYLSAAFPHVRQLSDLRRDPNLLGWFRSHCDQQPPLSCKTRHNYLLCLRRLLEAAALQGHLLAPDLICQQDLPRLPQYLPKPLCMSEDQLLQQELRRHSDELLANALLLIRATGIRVGECIDLSLDCLQPFGEGQWLMQVPLGKLHTERWVPADEEIQKIVARIIALRASISPRRPNGEGLLLPYGRSHDALYQALAAASKDAARRAGCSTCVTPHRLRHTFASEMIRLGVGLPALKRMLGHNDIRMTMRYVEVTQLDLQREFHTARHNAVQPHRMPLVPLLEVAVATGLPGIRQAISTARHLLETYRRDMPDEKQRRRVQRLDTRLRAVILQLDTINTTAK